MQGSGRFVPCQRKQLTCLLVEHLGPSTAVRTDPTERARGNNGWCISLNNFDKGAVDRSSGYCGEPTIEKESKCSRAPCAPRLWASWYKVFAFSRSGLIPTTPQRASIWGS